MNPQHLRARSEIIRMIRRFFDERGYLEMHTPRLVGLPGQEPHLEPFWTEVKTHQQLAAGSWQLGAKTLEEQTPAMPPTDGAPPTEVVNCQLLATSCQMPAALVTSPEYMMKRLIAAGFEKIYDLGPCFRNGEPWDGTHDPEFLLLEWYRKNADLSSLMDECEEMVKWVEKKLVASSWQLGTEIPRFQIPDSRFQRLTVEEAWREYAGIELAPLLGDREAMARVCRERNQTVADGDTWDDLYFKIFLSEIEPRLSTFFAEGESPPKADTPLEYASGGDFRLSLDLSSGRRSTFLYRYPASMAALARRSIDDPRWADRVELYMGGLELANGFAELSDPIEQYHRFEEDRTLRHNLGKKTWPLDEKFLADLPKMGNAAGIAFGVDRFVMLLTGATSINDVIPSSAKERFELSPQLPRNP